MSADMSEDEGGPLSAQDWPTTDMPGSPADSAKSDIEMEDKPSTGGTPSQPQKRRRVTRACDECRRKKIKCDGKQPCTHCSVYSYDCTYDKPSNRRRNPAPQYIEALEGRLQRAEAMLRKFVPEVDLADPNLDPAVQQEFVNRERLRAAQATKFQANHPMPEPGLPNDIKIASMIDTMGQLDLGPNDGWEYHGSTSGAVFLGKMKDRLRGLLESNSKDSSNSKKAPFLTRQASPAGLLDLDTSLSLDELPELPPKETGRKLCYYSLSCATCMLRLVHVPSFYVKMDKVYHKPVESMSVDEKRFLGLLYAVMALGCMYVGLDDSSQRVKEEYQKAAEEGAKYYKASRALIQDISQCSDLTSLQALVFMILFIQATSNLGRCYSFIGIALRSAMGMGLHRHIRHEKLGPLEQEVRSRVFYVIRNLDIYVSTLLGYPILLSQEDLDQTYPTEVDDEHISVRGITYPPAGTPSFFQAFNAHTRLMEILVKVVKYVDPMKGTGPGVGTNDKSHATCQVSYSRIKEIERDLQQWFERLPESWRPSPEGPIEVIRVRHLLRFAYAHVQLVLYRPFLHYVSPQLKKGAKIDEFSYACAAAAISVSRNIVHIGLEIRKQRVLSGPYWFMFHTELFAVLSLVFYAMENPDKPGSPEVLQDARAGRQMIEDLADHSQTANRVSKTLKDLFDQLPENLDQVRKRAATHKKRATQPQNPAGAPAPTPIAPQTMPAGRPPSLTRSRTGNFVANMFGRSASRTSVDSVAQTEPSYQDSNSFTASLQEYMPLDMSARATPDSGSTVGSGAAGFPSQMLRSQNPMNKVDSLMFSSDDPFQYPNQPIMELDFKGDGGQMAMASHAADGRYFMTPGMDDMSQFLGQPPPYHMMQPHQSQGLPMNPGMYDPQALMGLPPGSGHESQQGQGMQQHMQRSVLAQRRAHVLRSQERQIDQMFTAQGMQPDWGSFFGSGRGGFQGM